MCLWPLFPSQLSVFTECRLILHNYPMFNVVYFHTKEGPHVKNLSIDVTRGGLVV